MLVFFVAGDFASALAPDTPSQRTPMLPDFFRAEPALIPKERQIHTCLHRFFSSSRHLQLNFRT